MPERERTEISISNAGGVVITQTQMFTYDNPASIWLDIDQIEPLCDALLALLAELETKQ